MGHALSQMAVSVVVFVRTSLGLITRPYETYRNILRGGTIQEVLVLAGFVAIYFALASLLKVASFRPFLLTEKFILLYGTALGSVLFSTAIICMAGRMLGSKVQFERMLIAWSYTLVPTVCWFFATSLLYVVLPPPRTASIPGVVFSLLFIIFSVTLLGWKVTLSYLALRFGFKFDLKKNLFIVVLVAPVFAGWSMFLYRCGLFKVPFL